MSKPYIKGGTPVGTESLCRTCCHAHIMSGYRESESLTLCLNVNPNVVVPFVIYECSSYYDRNRPSWLQMQKLAINVTPGPLKRVGFKVSAGFQSAASEADEEDDAASD
jgi:hypothetical protein